MDNNVKKEWLTPLDLEREFDLKVSLQAKLRMRKTIPYSRVGRTIRYSRTKINKWLENAEVL